MTSVPATTAIGLSVSSAVVTGASRGIGLAVAQNLVSAGMRVVLLARSADALQRVTSALGDRAHAVVCDLTKAADVQRALAEIETIIGLPEVLVNCAGIFPLASIADTNPEAFAMALQTNLIGPFQVLRAFVAPMRARGSGHVVTVGSVADRTAFPENVAYAASKFGARAVHEVLREELRGTGVRATLVSPGPVNTSIWDRIDPDNRPGFPRRSEMLTALDVADAVAWVITRPPQVNVDELRLSRT